METPDVAEKSSCLNCIHNEICTERSRIKEIFEQIIEPVYPGPNKHWAGLWEMAAKVCRYYAN